MATSDLKRDRVYEDIFSWKHVLKWSYPKSNRISEREIIIKAKKVLESHDNYPDPSGKALTVMISNSLPDVLNGYDIYERNKNLRAFLGIRSKEDRVPRFTMLEYLEPIYSLPNLVQFKEAIRHIAIAIHYLASSKEGIKHRDINVNNLMFRRLSDDQTQGVLCDWDQASTYETEKSNDHTETRYGTRAFLSIDMHQTPPPVHIERFDYESLFYVMYWTSMNFAEGKFLPEKEKDAEVREEWKFWNVESDKRLAEKKVAFLNAEKPLCYSPGLFTPFFLPIVELWLDPLRNLLQSGYYLLSRQFRSQFDVLDPPLRNDDLATRRVTVDLETHQKHVLAKFDHGTLGGRVCFENIWSILER